MKSLGIIFTSIFILGFLFYFLAEFAPFAFMPVFYIVVLVLVFLGIYLTILNKRRN